VNRQASLHRDSFLPKVPGQVAGWTQQVTLPYFIAGLLPASLDDVIILIINEKNVMI